MAGRPAVTVRLVRMHGAATTEDATPSASGAGELKDPRALAREQQLDANRRSVAEMRETQVEIENVLRSELAELKKRCVRAAGLRACVVSSCTRCGWACCGVVVVACLCASTLLLFGEGEAGVAAFSERPFRVRMEW
jgi:hypothetical protein